MPSDEDWLIDWKRELLEEMENKRKTPVAILSLPHYATTDVFDYRTLRLIEAIERDLNGRFGI